MARQSTRAPFTASAKQPYPKKSKSKGKSSDGIGTTTDAAGPSKKGSRKGSNGLRGQAQRRQADLDDAYTFVPSLPKRHRTSEAQLSLSREEAGPSTRRRPQRRAGDGGEGSEEDEGDDDEDMEERIRRVAMQIADEGPGEVEDDESDIDSDNAWEEEGSDEERWGEVFRDLNKGKRSGKGKSKAKEIVRKPSKPLTVNLDEDDEPVTGSSRGRGLRVEENDDLEDEVEGDTDADEDEEQDDETAEDSQSMTDDEAEFTGFGSVASDAEDDDNEEDLRAFGPGNVTATSHTADLPSESDEEVEGGDDHAGGDEEEDDDDDDDEAISEPSLPSDDDASDGGNDDDAAIAELDAFVDGLAAEDAKKRKVAFSDDPAGRSDRRQVLPVVSGPAVGDASATLKGGKLDIATLLASHPSLASARALLPSKSRPADPSSSSSILKSGVLPAPLPTFIQDRLDREAAYAKTREEGQKWSGVMKRVREAEHLSFPLQPSGAERGGVKSGGELLTAWKPQNEMESAVQRLLDQANLTEKGITAAEDQALQGQDLSIEEIAARRAELRRQRELMFRAENKAKRVAKIKSKTFRKLARKRAEKEGLSVEDLERLEPGSGAMEAEREKMERLRAQERATLRHGAKNKFGREAMEGDFGNVDRRRAREEMLDLKEKLSRRIAGRGSGGEESESDDDDDEADEDGERGEGDEEGIKARAFDQLAALDSAARSAQGEKDKAEKGLMGMKFMQKARERDMMRVKEAQEAAKRDIMLFGRERGKGGSEDEDVGEEGEEERQMMKLGEGRMVFSGGAKANSAAHSDGGGEADGDRGAGIAPRRQANGRPMTLAKSAAAGPRSPSPLRSPSPSINPWMTVGALSGPSRKRNQATASTAADKATAALKKAKVRDTAQNRAEEDERVDISLNPSFTGSTPGQRTTAGGSKKRKANTVPVGNDHRLDAAGEGEEEEEGEDDADRDLVPTSNSTSSRPAMFKQRDLVAEAFAGGNVVADFEKEKKRQMEEDAPTTVDTTLPGWGSWGGKGLKKRRKPNPSFLLKTAGVAAPQRKDFGQSNVIITEKTERKAKKLLPKDLPYPYTSVAQYQASLAAPVGAEWNSRRVVQKETMPRVVKKPGAILEPVRRLF